MKKALLIVLFFLCLQDLFAQNRNSVWCFGDSAGIDFNGAIPLPIVTSLDTRGSCVSVADTAGQLLFYANTRAAMGGNTTLVWNKLNQLMQGGDSIVGEGWFEELLIIPKPNDSLNYFLFSGGVSSVFQPGFYFSIIDISQNGGLGAVIQKNMQLQGQNFWFNDGLAAIKHGNGRDWWVILRRYDYSNNEFYFYLLTPFGISLDHIQNIGDFVWDNSYRINPSNDGSKIAGNTVKGLITTYDFDRCAGYLSNEIFIEHEQTSSILWPWYWDCELSPDNNLLYVSEGWTDYDSLNYLLQFNLNDSAPSLTRDTLYSVNRPVEAGLIELAPDGKIYWSCAFAPPGTFFYPYPDSVHNFINENLSVINSPDSLEAACDFQPFSFYLGGKRTYYGLPNNPNYELGRLVGSPCDTLTGIFNIEQGLTNAELFVFYHTGWQKLFVNAQNLKGKNCLLQIFDMNGREVYASPPTPLRGRGGYFTQDVNCNDFAKGMYVVSLQAEKEKLVKKFIKN